MFIIVLNGSWATYYKVKRGFMKKDKHNGPYLTVIDYEQLDKLCAIQCTGEECAAIMKMDYDTLNRRLKQEGHGGFTDYFKTKSAYGKASLRRRQFKAAEDGNATMLVWLGKQWLGQFDKPSDAFEFDKSASLSDQAVQILDAVANGHLAVDCGKQLVDSIKGLSEIIANTELKDRIKAIEEKLNIEA